jgi:hypothetical protein
MKINRLVSLAERRGESKMKKLQKELQKETSFLWLHKNEMEIDDKNYQRDQGKPKTQRKIQRIVEEFDWKKFNSLLVSRRSFQDGKLFCVDGGGRLTAARQRSDIDKVPCMVFNASSLAEEAEIFVDIDDTGQRIDSRTRFKAMRSYGHRDAILIERLVESSGRRIDSFNGPDTVSCVGTLMSLARQQSTVLEKIWPVVTEIMDGGQFYSTILEALFYIERHILEGSLTEQQHRNKMKTLDVNALLKIMRSEAVEIGKGGSRPWGIGLVKFLNKGARTRRRIELSDRVVR